MDTSEERLRELVAELQEKWVRAHPGQAPDAATRTVWEQEAVARLAEEQRREREAAAQDAGGDDWGRG